MSFLPIVERELRVAARRRATYWLRTGAGLVAVLVFFWMWVGELLQRIPGTGARLFLLLSCGAFGFCLAAGALFTADSISEEKREGTLGLLFLTRLRGYDVVIGKLVGSALGAFYGLAAILPVLALPLVLGGVTGDAVVRCALALGNALFVSVAAGLMISVVSRRDRMAMGGTLGFMFLLSFGVVGWDRMVGGAGSLARPVWAVLSPAYCLYLAHDTGSLGGLFWTCWLVQHGLGWFLVAMACLLVSRVMADRPVLGIGSESWTRRVAARMEGVLSAPVIPIALVEEEPYRWMVARGRLNPVLLWVGLVGIAVVAELIGLTLSHPTAVTLAMFGAVVLLQGVVKLWMASESVHRLAEDRRLGTLELLLASRVGPEVVVRGVREGLKARGRGPAVFAVLAGFLAAGVAEIHGGEGALFWWLVSVLVLWSDLWTIRTVGPWAGLSEGRANRAALVVIGKILVVPWLVFLGLLLLFGIQWRTGFSLAHAWLVICVLNNLVWWSRAVAGLREDYEILAAERFGGGRMTVLLREKEPELVRGVADLFVPEPGRREEAV